MASATFSAAALAQSPDISSRLRAQMRDRAVVVLSTPCSRCPKTTGRGGKAKYLNGTDGAASSIRKRLHIPLDGCSAAVCWGIMGCVFDTNISTHT